MWLSGFRRSWIEGGIESGLRLPETQVSFAVKFLAALFVAIAAVLLSVSAAVSVTTTKAASVTSRTVPLVCPHGDNRSAYDASVQPGIIVLDFTGWPDVPVTYTAYGWNAQSSKTQIVGNINEVGTTDHLVAAWENSTNCFGASQGGGDISRNAWVVDSTGHVFGQGDLSGPPANNFGDASNLTLNKPIVGMTPTPDGKGYWLVASDGGIFDYGDAGFFGSAGSIHLNQPIVGMAVTPGGKGYTLVASDGGVFNYGDSQFYGSLPGVLKPGQTLNAPIEGIVETPDGDGYWMVAADGGVFSFGDAHFLGSEGSHKLASPIAGMLPNSDGYTLVAQDGTLYPFSGQPVATPAAQGPAPTTTTTSTTTTQSSGGTCTSPSYSTSEATGSDNTDPNDSEEYWWVDNDAWDGSHGPQTLYVCNQSSWYAVSNQTDNGGQVETYPNTEYDVGGRDNGTTKPLSAYGSITSTFNEAFPTTGTSFDAAYDLWTNNWSDETMIWNQWDGTDDYWGQCAEPGANQNDCVGAGGAEKDSVALTLDGVAYHFLALGSGCTPATESNCEYIFFRDSQVSSGSVDILAAYNWEVANGYAASSDVPTQLEYGAEVIATTGAQTFPLNGLTFNLS